MYWLSHIELSGESVASNFSTETTHTCEIIVNTFPLNSAWPIWCLWKLEKFEKGSGAVACGEYSFFFLFCEFNDKFRDKFPNAENVYHLLKI